MTNQTLDRRDHLVMQITALLYVVAVAQAAHYSGWHYLLFPALAALSDSILTRPWGRWANQPGRLVSTPTLGAFIGTLITRTWTYQVFSVLLVVTLCLLLMSALKSNISPAIAAGMLPLVLGIKSFLYPVCVMTGLVGLAIIVVPLRRHFFAKYQQLGAAGGATGGLETTAAAKNWMLPFFLFLAVMAWSATASGLRLILFPPLVVMAYEIFTHATSCPWALKPVTLPVACFLTAIAGCVAVKLFGNGPTAAGCSMAAGILILRVLQIHMPPALATGLLPVVINSPDFKYPAAVCIGTLALMLVFLLHRKFTRQGRMRPNISKGMRSIWCRIVN